MTPTPARRPNPRLAHPIYEPGDQPVVPTWLRVILRVAVSGGVGGLGGALIILLVPPEVVRQAWVAIGITGFGLGWYVCAPLEMLLARRLATMFARRADPPESSPSDPQWHVVHRWPRAP